MKPETSTLARSWDSTRSITKSHSEERPKLGFHLIFLQWLKQGLQNYHAGGVWQGPL